MIKKITAVCLACFLLFSCNACSVRNVTAGMEEGESWQWNYKGCLLTLYALDGALSMDLVPE